MLVCLSILKVSAGAKYKSTYRRV